MYQKTKWLRVSKSERCPVCGHHDYCTRSASGEVCKCMRIESDHSAPGTFGGWIHKLTDPLPPRVVKEKPNQDQPQIDWGAEAMRMARLPEAVKTRTTVAEELGVSVGSLEALCVGLGWDDYRQQLFSSWPQRDATGRCTGILRRYVDGRKLTMRGGKGAGIYYWHPHWWLGIGPVVVTEGGSDAAAMIGLGLSCLSRNSNIHGVEHVARLMKLAGKSKAVVIGERDEKPEVRGRTMPPGCPDECRCCMLCWPGLEGAKRTTRWLREAGVDAWTVLLPHKDARSWMLANPSATGADFIEECRGGIQQ